MSEQQRKYDSTIARVAGNILSGMSLSITDDDFNRRRVEMSVRLAREVVAEVQRTTPEGSTR